MRVDSGMKDDTGDRHRVWNAKRKVREFMRAHLPETLNKLARDEGNRMDDRQEVHSLPSNATSSSSSATPAGTKRSAAQDAEDLRKNDQELEPSGIAIQTIMRTVTACSWVHGR